ncbi:MAG: M24 family metallopeptidase [Acidobacteriota bacterium]
MHDFTHRYRRLMRQLAARQLDGFLTTHPPHLRYLFNFSGSSGMACCVDGAAFLLVDSRYIEQARQETTNCTPVLATSSLEGGLREVWRKCWPASSPRIAVESEHISHGRWLRLKAWSESCQWVPTQDVIEEFRLLKDASEIGLIEKAFEMALTAFAVVSERLEPGLTETEIAGLLELEMRRAGAERPAFQTLVASGPRSSLPHGVATARVVGEGELVLLDFGAVFGGYCSDLTRVVLLPGCREPDILGVVREAQQAALQAIRPGVLTTEIDNAARAVISKAGLGDCFGHGTGHGLGLEVHELPRVSQRWPRRVLPGMVFTLEPGIYLPGRCGVRLEDAVLVTEEGYRPLSH